jgi:iron donor protein CyaY
MRVFSLSMTTNFTKFTDEAHFRDVMKRTLDRVEKSFDNVDPDLVECSLQFGALTLQFSDGQKCILSAQPSVSQLWMAVASRGIALHFNYDHTQGVWMDDKGHSIELFQYLEKFLTEKSGEPFFFVK